MRLGSLFGVSARAATAASSGSSSIMLWTGRPADLDAVEPMAGFHNDPADRLPRVPVSVLNLDAGAHRLERPDEPGARLVETNVLDHKPAGKRARHNARDRKAAVEMSPGKVSSNDGSRSGGRHAHRGLRLLEGHPQ